MKLVILSGDYCLFLCSPKIQIIYTKYNGSLLSCFSLFYIYSEEKLIRQQIEYHVVTVFVSMSPQTIYMSGLDPQGDNMDIPVRVLDCDAISQVKEKALDTIYRAFPYSQRPKKEDLDLEWRTGTSGRLILYDEDSTTKTEGDW